MLFFEPPSILTNAEMLNIKQWLSIKRIILSIALGLLIISGVYGVWIEPYQIDVKHVTINNETISTALKDKIAVHLSDLHINKIGKREKQILKLIEDLNPDLIFLTGDYVKWCGDYESALSFLSELKAPMGVWAVMGDYDYSSSRKSCLFCHKQGSGNPTRKHHVRFLRNEAECISLSNGDAWLQGIDPEAELNYRYDTEKNLLEQKIPAIILSHDPLMFNSIANDRDVLILAGDTHGGQIPLPRWLWNIMGYEKNFRFNHGFFHEGHKMMYVSRGIGSSHLPIRLLRPPELVVLHF